jgi:hypothetical protein
VLKLQIADIKCEIERLRAELYKRIETVREEGICLDKKLYEMSRNIDNLIIAYTKEQKII